MTDLATVLTRPYDAQPSADRAAPPPPRTGVRPLRLAGQLLLVGAIAALLFELIDWGKAGSALRGAEVRPLAGAFLVSVAGVLLSAFKWRGVLLRLRIDLSLPQAARLYWIGMFASNFLPSSVGGDAVRLLLTPARHRLGEVAGSILVERLTGFLIMLLLCIVTLLARPTALLQEPAAHGVLLGVIGLIAGISLVLMAPQQLLAVMGWLHDRLPGLLRPPVAMARRIAAGVTPACSRPAVREALLLSIPFYLTIMLAQYGVLKAVGASVSLVDVALLAPLVCLLAILPVPLNGLGFTEGVFVLIYAGVGVPPELALAAAVLRRLVDLCNSGLGGLLWLWQPKATAQAEQPAQADPAAGAPPPARPQPAVMTVVASRRSGRSGGTGSGPGGHGPGAGPGYPVHLPARVLAARRSQAAWRRMDRLRRRPGQ